MIRDLRGRAVLVTGGTRGIGLATALAFAGRGASCILTYRWGGADEDEILRRFSEVGASPPLIVQGDVSKPEDTESLLSEIRRLHEQIDVFISNASAAVVVNDLEDLTERALMKTIRYTTWPTLGYLLEIKKVFDRYPRYVVAMSSDGPDYFSRGYDLVAASKATLETLCRYVSYRLRDEDVCFNVLRTRAVRTKALDDTFGAEFEEFVRPYVSQNDFIDEAEVADVALALCSGLLDGLRGQVINVDRGGIFRDNIMRMYAERDQLGL